ncbi:MAG: cold shock domain-containing protein [Proteobacteria bacterium]|nr:cold shock domain-containing protein [Pseudomonadota bacterium]
MTKGSVKWFNNAKGYGFIIPEEGDEELFAHHTAIAMEGYRTLNADERVEFDLLRSDQGLQAKNIRRCTDSIPIKTTEPADKADPEDTQQACAHKAECEAAESTTPVNTSEDL